MKSKGVPPSVPEIKKTRYLNVSDHADVVLKKSDEKILSGDKVMLLCKSVFLVRDVTRGFSASWGHSIY